MGEGPVRLFFGKISALFLSPCSNHTGFLVIPREKYSLPLVSLYLLFLPWSLHPPFLLLYVQKMSSIHPLFSISVASARVYVTLISCLDWIAPVPLFCGHIHSPHHSQCDLKMPVLYFKPLGGFLLGKEQNWSCLPWPLNDSPSMFLLRVTSPSLWRGMGAEKTWEKV